MKDQNEAGYSGLQGLSGDAGSPGANSAEASNNREGDREGAKGGTCSPARASAEIHGGKGTKRKGVCRPCAAERASSAEPASSETELKQRVVARLQVETPRAAARLALSLAIRAGHPVFRLVARCCVLALEPDASAEAARRVLVALDSALSYEEDCVLAMTRHAVDGAGLPVLACAVWVVEACCRRTSVAEVARWWVSVERDASIAIDVGDFDPAPYAENGGAR